MTYLLFENPKYLLLFLVITDVVLIFFLKAIPFEKKKIIIIVIAILIPLIHIISRVIETDNEKVEKVLIEISQNSNKLQIDSITPFLDNTFNGEFNKKNYSKKEFIILLKDKVGKKIISAINFKKKSITFNKNKAESVIISFVDFTTTEGAFRLPLRWKIKWVKQNDSWYIYNTQTPEIVRF